MEILDYELNNTIYLRYKDSINMENSFENSELILLEFESYFDKFIKNEQIINNIEYRRLFNDYNKLIETFVSKYFNHIDLIHINNWFISYQNTCKYDFIFNEVKVLLIPIYVSDYLTSNQKLFMNHFSEEFEEMYGKRTKNTYKNSIELKKINFSLYRTIISKICTFYVQIYFRISDEDDLNHILRKLLEDYLQRVAFCKYETIHDIKKDMYSINMEEFYYETYLQFIDDLQIKTLLMSNTYRLNEISISNIIHYYTFVNLLNYLNSEIILHNLEYLMSNSINKKIFIIIENTKLYINKRIYEDYLID